MSESVSPPISSPFLNGLGFGMSPTPSLCILSTDSWKRANGCSEIPSSDLPANFVSTTLYCSPVAVFHLVLTTSSVFNVKISSPFTFVAHCRSTQLPDASFIFQCWEDSFILNRIFLGLCISIPIPTSPPPCEKYVPNAIISGSVNLRLPFFTPKSNCCPKISVSRKPF